ncbi:MAG: hypothetical protein JO122_04960, partial [Acetobacteraceae bacterium]|nr:hypothetical protein [Acetobacteraceae bacterium]
FGARSPRRWRTGKLQNEAQHGEDPFTALYAAPERLRGFLAVMSGISMRTAQAIAATFPSENAFGFLLSLHMLIETPGGFEYTASDCQSWMREVGFSETRVEHLVGPDSMVIGNALTERG